MQKEENNIEELSRHRQDLRRLLNEMSATVKVAFGRGPLVKGNVYEIARKCGKPTCACTQGALHRSMVLSRSQGGKTRLMAVPPQRLAELRSKSEEYLRVRRTRARVSVLYKQILAVMDRIEKLRMEEP